MNHAISKQTGDSVTEIARHGFSLMSEEGDESCEPDDSDDTLLLLIRGDGKKRKAFSVQLSVVEQNKTLNIHTSFFRETYACET
ncbi:MAG: hypothetical protein U0936_12470 [Planctomycetaceae bacterium]